jgi:hypothetical protein
MELWALIDRSTPQVGRLLGNAVDVFLGEEEARQALAGILGDEPQWAEILAVVPVGLSDPCPN